jgi:hypothetical protein
MATPEAKDVSKDCGATAEPVNADLRARGMDQLRVGDTKHALTSLVWAALTYNLLRLVKHLSLAGQAGALERARGPTVRSTGTRAPSADRHPPRGARRATVRRHNECSPARRRPAAEEHTSRPFPSQPLRETSGRGKRKVPSYSAFSLERSTGIRRAPAARRARRHLPATAVGKAGAAATTPVEAFAPRRLPSATASGTWLRQAGHPAAARCEHSRPRPSTPISRCKISSRWSCAPHLKMSDPWFRRGIGATERLFRSYPMEGRTWR